MHISYSMCQFAQYLIISINKYRYNFLWTFTYSFLFHYMTNVRLTIVLYTRTFIGIVSRVIHILRQHQLNTQKTDRSHTSAPVTQVDFHSFVNKTRHAIGALHLTRYTYVYTSLSLSLPLLLSLNSSFPTSHKFTSINLQFEYGDERPFPSLKDCPSRAHPAGNQNESFSLFLNAGSRANFSRHDPLWKPMQNIA